MEIGHNTQLCPDRDRLREFQSGGLSDDEWEQLAEHLDSCDICREVIADLSDSGDPLEQQIRAAYQQRPQAVDEPILQRLLATPPGASSDDNLGPGRIDLGTTFELPSQIGPYQVLGRLGEGGMGLVLRAVHRHLERNVALKILPVHRRMNARVVERFQAEMRALGRLDHPVIVRPTDAGVADGLHYLAMELVDGLTITQLMRTLGRMPLPAAAAIGVEVCRGLIYLNQQKLIHRDLKPSNLMVTRQGAVRILDLGLVRFPKSGEDGESMTSAGQVLGTPDYMSPEQIDQSPVIDIRADLYSLGCCLYAMTSGRPPFAEARGTFAKLDAHRRQPVPKLAAGPWDLPPEFCELVACLMAKDPQRRVQTPEQLAVRLSRWADFSRLAGLVAESEASLRGEASVAEISTATRQTDTLNTRPRRMSLQAALMGVLAVGLLGGVVAMAAWLGPTDDRLAGAVSPSAVVLPSDDVARPPLEPPGTSAATPRPNRWHNLLESSPRALLWPRGDTASVLNYHPEREQVTLVSDDSAYVELGEVQSDSATVQLVLYKSRWSGNAGIYFGSQAMDEGRQLQLQFVGFRLRDRHNPSEGHLATRGYNRVYRDATGGYSITSHLLTSNPLETPQGDLMIELRIDQGMLSDIRFDGQPAPRLVEGFPAQDSPDLDCRGGLGIYAVSDTLVVRSARFMIREPHRLDVP